MGGAAVGVGFSFGLFFLIGFFRDGYRYIDELEDIEDSAPLLGTLPDLSAGELANDEVAALAVHHLRNMLQLRDGRKERAVYTITSATSGDGKTSLALALGMSFAVSGRRTILVDADLVGRGLTHELGLEGLPGLCQAVESRSLNGEAHATRIEDLSALPCGDTARFEPEQLSQRGLGAVIEQLREQYEIVIIDTGPILGSLEANLVSVLSDGVVLTVSRGRSPKLVSASIERLKRIGGRCSGLVFNKAAAKDLERSVSHLSFASASVRSQPREGREAGSGRSGVLLRAVGRPGLPETEAQPSSKAS
jgi:Mrp family chromosome partitioning ATPase